MTSLLDLPDDIFLEILSYFETSKPNLLSISKLNRRFSVLARSYIFRHVRLSITPHASTEAGFGPTRNRHSSLGILSYLFCSFAENAALPPLVRTVQIKWSIVGGRDIWKAAINNLLALLPNVIHLELSSYHQFYRHGMEIESFRPTFLRSNPMPKLRTITLDIHALSTTILKQFMVMPSVESIAVSRIHDPNLFANWNSIDTKNDPPTHLNTSPTHPPLAALSNIATLDLGTNRIPLLTLRTILSHAPILNRLKLTLPGRGRESRHLPQIERQLHPAQIVQALEPVRETLQDLDMINDRHAWLGSDGTRADFRAFKRLRKMRVAPGLFFAWAAFGQGEHMQVDQGFVWDKEDRSGVWKLLPKSLEEFEIHFHFDSAFLCASSPSLQTLTAHPTLSISLPSTTFLWLRELAIHKPTHFPLLHSVHATEQLDTGAGGLGIAFEQLAWAPPRELAAVFESAGVRLGVCLRSNRRVQQGEGDEGGRSGTGACCRVAAAYGRWCGCGGGV